MSLAPQVPAGELDSAFLGIVLNAETAREGAMALLRELEQVFGPMPQPTALAVRDRDGLTLHVLAEQGDPQRWPPRLEPQFALGSKSGVDPGTGVYVLPLRASGRVVGALLFGNATRAASLAQSAEFEPVFETTAAVLHLLVSRTDSEVRRRAEALRSVDAIVDGMAHQIANPLTGASAIAQLLADELDGGQRAAVNQMRQELDRAFAVLSDLLDFHRDTRAQDGILDLNAVVERIVRFRGYAIREQGIALDVELSRDFFPVRADARGLEHALLIALRHAELRSHGTVNRRILVRTLERPEGELAVRITDSGPGDSPDLVPAYFDIPFRAEQALPSTVVETDLGLVESLLRGCGGRLEVNASKADGTTLAFVFPRAYTHINPTSRKTA